MIARTCTKSPVILVGSCAYPQKLLPMQFSMAVSRLVNVQNLATPFMTTPKLSPLVPLETLTPKYTSKNENTIMSVYERIIIPILKKKN